MADSSSQFSSREADVLAGELTDYSEFRKRVIIRHDLLRMGVLLCAVGGVAGVMNAIVVAGRTETAWAAIASGWFSATGSGWLFTVLFRILAVGSIVGLVAGIAVLAYAPFHRTRAYRNAHAAFCERGWVARGCPSGLTVDDDSIWIKHDVDVIVWSAKQSGNDSKWKRDCARITRDFAQSDRKMMAALLLEDRKFHGLLTIGQLRSEFGSASQSQRSSYIGFGPLHRIPARTDIAVVAPPSDRAVRKPQAFEDMLFWIRG